jgi:glycosyltransferase involved in cell wall biosynthesis
LRIYVLTPGFPPKAGGQEQHLLQLSQSLIAAGAQVRVITHRYERALPVIDSVGSVPLVRLSPVGTLKGAGFRVAPRLGLLLCRMVWRLLRDRHDYQAVLVSGFNFMPWSAVAAAMLTRKPCVVRPESPLELTEFVGADSRRKMGLSERSLPLRLLGALRRRAAHRVDRYIAISSEIQSGLGRLGIGAEKIVPVPNGIDIERFRPVAAERKSQLRALLGLPAEPLLMIYTGRLALTKGVMMLIDVWGELAAAHPQAHLVIVGTGRGSFDDCERQLNEFIAAHGLGARVTLTGNVPNVHEYLQASDLFLFPSDYEGFGLSLLEAMAVGLPMVSTRVGVTVEIAARGEFGILVPPQDRESFRQAVNCLIPDAARRAGMGANAHEAVQAGYSSMAEARRYIDVFAQLIERKPS